MLDIYYLYYQAAVKELLVAGPVMSRCLKQCAPCNSLTSTDSTLAPSLQLDTGYQEMETATLLFFFILGVKAN